MAGYATSVLTALAADRSYTDYEALPIPGITADEVSKEESSAEEKTRPMRRQVPRQMKGLSSSGCGSRTFSDLPGLFSSHTAHIKN